MGKTDGRSPLPLPPLPDLGPRLGHAAFRHPSANSTLGKATKGSNEFHEARESSTVGQLSGRAADGLLSEDTLRGCASLETPSQLSIPVVLEQKCISAKSTAPTPTNLGSQECGSRVFFMLAAYLRFRNV